MFIDIIEGWRMEGEKTRGRRLENRTVPQKKTIENSNNGSNKEEKK